MNNKRQKTTNIKDIQVKAQKQLIDRLVLKNLKGGGIIGCPPPIFD